MCGHVGIAGNLDADSMKVFKDLLYMDALRGQHGTGMALVPWNGKTRDIDDVTVIKSPAPAVEFLRNTAVTSALRSTSHSVVLGHNRHATQGSHVYHNTHPFIGDTVVGAHNGTVASHNMRKLQDVDKDYEEFGTDSEALLATLGRTGPKKTFKALTSGSQGAWAVVWYDTTENTLNFTRNAMRTLYYVLSKDRAQLAWASESYMLKAAISRNDAQSYDLSKVKMFAVDVTHSWCVPAVGQIFREEPSTEKTPGKKPVTSARSTNVNKRITQGGTANSSAWKANDRNIVSPPSTFNFLLTGYDLDDAEIIKLFKKGEPECSQCSINIPKEDFEKELAKSVDANTHFCSECVETAAYAAANKGYNRYATTS